MIYDRELKDYYCEKCKKSLNEIERPEDIEEAQKEPEASKESSQLPARPPEIGTIRGILFLLIGSIIFMIPAIVCQILPLIALFLLIFGFFIMYQDRKSQSKAHRINMRFAAILFVAWIISNVVILILTYYFSINLTDSISKLEQGEIIPSSVFIDYILDIRIITIISFLGMGLLAILRYLVIKDLIRPNFKKVLTIIVPIILVSGFMSMYVNLESSELYIDNLEDTTKDEFEKNGQPNYNLSPLNASLPLIYTVYFLSYATEAIMIFCFYWAYTYQREIQRKKEFSLL